MKLTELERSTLAMLHRILGNLEPEEAEYHERAVKILEDGYYELWDTEIIGHLSSPVPREEMTYVHDVLDMYRWLQDSYTALSDKDDIKESDVLFRGFDGNNETHLMGYARFLMEDMNRWSDLKHDPSLNTHHPTERQYHAMMTVLPKFDARKLTLEEIKAVLAARFT